MMLFYSESVLGPECWSPHDDNERFDELRREIYDLAKRLNKWGNVGD